MHKLNLTSRDSIRSGAGRTKSYAHIAKIPSPANFDAYLPWACLQLLPEVFIVVKRKELIIDTPASSRAQKLRKEISTEIGTHLESNLVIFSHDAILNVYSFYDGGDLSEIKILKNKTVPRNFLKILALLIQFHTTLTAIHIDSGLKQDGLYELSKILAISKVTQIILDNTVIKEGNYYILLENCSTIKYLSLARCCLNDQVIKELTSRLVYSLPASKCLSALNLSTNRITDIGVEYLGAMLRSNRQLSYLNLADNNITDKGADIIFNSLIKFRLTSEEIKDKSKSRFEYFKKKRVICQQYVMHMSDDDKIRLNKRQGTANKKSKVLEKGKVSAKTNDSSSHSINQIERAEVIAESVVGPFYHPFSPLNLVYIDGNPYCLGNNTLSYLNVAFNDLSYISVKKLREVLVFQFELDRKPKGLMNCCIEGNNIPRQCREYDDINSLIARSGIIRKSSYAANKDKKTTKNRKWDPLLSS